jgi:hypothetical protein
LKQKKTHQLDGNHNLPFALIALSCHESLLKTAWNINKKLNLDLRESDIVIKTKENPDKSFAVFCDRESSSVQFYSLISNKSSSLILVKELPNIDFFIEISGEIKREDIASIIKEIKQIQGITAALEVNPEKIKRKSAFRPI